MNVNTSFSHDVEWKCLEEMVKLYPASRQRVVRSSIIREGVEILSKIKKSKQTTNLDDYKEDTLPRLELDNKTWKDLAKSSEVQELRQLQKTIQMKLNIINEEIYRRTL